MTERQQKMIEAYLPHPRDDSLDLGEYYYKRDDGKVFKVYISDIFPHKESTHYGCRYSSNGQRVHTCYEWDGIPKRQLYDNKEDCKDDAHLMCDYWEELRELQNKQDGD